MSAREASRACIADRRDRAVKFVRRLIDVVAAHRLGSFAVGWFGQWPFTLVRAAGPATQARAGGGAGVLRLRRMCRGRAAGCPGAQGDAVGGRARQGAVAREDHALTVGGRSPGHQTTEWITGLQPPASRRVSGGWHDGWSCGELRLGAAVAPSAGRAGRIGPDDEPDVRGWADCSA